MDFNKFSLSKVYKLTSPNTEKIYIGSTTERYLSSRLSKHKAHYKLGGRYTATKIIECGKLQLSITTPTLKKLLNVDVNDNVSYIKALIESISFKNEVYDLEKFVSKEVKELVDNLPLSFLNEIEKIKHPELYMNLLEEGKEVEVSGRLTFFTFR
jgi:hypothetical protein